ncbi:MAG TPA: homoserine kinase [Candidatus Limnocylindrales bacterium]|nr:homoserine kinase [Candidatus Limnocylindrales bacterium]
MAKGRFDSGEPYGWRAVVPATSANLGCAFDCGGLALKLYLKVLFAPASQGGLTIEYKGVTPDRFPLEASNLILESLRFAASQLQAPEPHGHVNVESDIPIGVGLGSSAAAVIAGLLLGTRYSGGDSNPDEILRWAEKIEGHIDNAAAAYHGGLVLALCNNLDRVVCQRTDFPESIRLVIATPEKVVPTHEARQVLPAAYDRADVLHTLQRNAVLAATCFSGNFDLFPELFDDRLHQPYRQKLVPGMEQCLQLRHKGLLGIAISGSGSSVIAFTTANEDEIGERLREIFVEEGISATVRSTSADNHGAWVSREPVPFAARRENKIQDV